MPAPPSHRTGQLPAAGAWAPTPPPSDAAPDQSDTLHLRAGRGGPEFQPGQPISRGSGVEGAGSGWLLDNRFDDFNDRPDPFEGLTPTIPGARPAERGPTPMGQDRFSSDRYSANGPGTGELQNDLADEFDDEFDDDFDEEEIEESEGAVRNLLEWAAVLVGAVLLAVLLRMVLLQAFWIPSPSMESTLEVRDRVLVNKLSYRLGDISRGDIVVFSRTDAEIAQNPDLPRDVIKRVIALPGETIEIRNNEVIIDGLLLQEPYLDEGVITSDFGPLEVPEGEIFVMGDNRGASLDSRFETGTISEDRVVGRAFFLFWPLDRIGSL